MTPEPPPQEELWKNSLSILYTYLRFDLKYN